MAHEKLNPSFTSEDQEMAEQLRPIIVGPPAYTSPDPNTMAGRLVDVDEHPLKDDLADDYGATIAARETIDLREATDDETPNYGKMKKAKLVREAERRGLDVSGLTKEEVIDALQANDEENA